MAMKVRYTVVDGEVIAEKRNGVRRCYVSDSVGSTVALLDNTQTQTDTFAHWPYGEERSRTGTTPTPFRFGGAQGYYRDSASKTCVLARYLDTEKARWLTASGQGLTTGYFSPYAYALDSPVTYQAMAGAAAPGVGAAGIGTGAIVAGAAVPGGIIIIGTLCFVGLVIVALRDPVGPPSVRRSRWPEAKPIPFPRSRPTQEDYYRWSRRRRRRIEPKPEPPKYDNCDDAFSSCMDVRPKHPPGYVPWENKCLFCLWACQNDGMGAWQTNDCDFWNW
jgi:hypothetical protein